MDDTLDHSLVNLNQLCNDGITVLDNPFPDIQTHIATEDESVFIPLEQYVMKVSLVSSV